jgi:hypothetical protein
VHALYCACSGPVVSHCWRFLHCRDSGSSLGLSGNAHWPQGRNRARQPRPSATTATAREARPHCQIRTRVQGGRVGEPRSERAVIALLLMRDCRRRESVFPRINIFTEAGNEGAPLRGNPPATSEDSTIRGSQMLATSG